MDKQNNLQLCGGTFLVLLFEAKGQRRAARTENGRPSDKISNPEIFGSLVKFTNPDFIMPEGRSFGTFTSDYKLCRKSDSPASILNDEEVIHRFDTAIRCSYTSKLQAFYLYLSGAIGIKTKGNWLVAALIDLIREYRTIPGQADFIFKKMELLLQKRNCRTSAFRLLFSEYGTT